MNEKLQIWLDKLAAFGLERLIPAVLLLIFGFLLARFFIRLATAALKKTKAEENMSRLILAVLRPVLFLLVALSAAGLLGIDVTGIVALASVLTLAISLSLQGVLGNVFGGFTLLYTRPFSPGHYVEIAGRLGTVQEVGIAYTKLCTPDNKIISIPNSSVVAAEIVNYTVSGKRRVDLVVTCAWDTPAETVKEALLEAAAFPGVLETPAPSVGLLSYQEGIARYQLMLWANTADVFPVTFGVNQNIQKVFLERGISITAPHWPEFPRA